ncbi:MAG TPA: DUF2264 domain-containing protein [Candidatus Limnocylindrales bacterium]|nr:DUF2264 domain-containing protein [Candidatus Limnocylindrales bacterium]
MTSWRDLLVGTGGLAMGALACSAFHWRGASEALPPRNFHPRPPSGAPWQGNAFKTKQDVEQALLDCFEPLVSHFSAGGARVRLAGFGATSPRVATELEGFARPLFGIVPFARGGGRFPHWALYQRGLAAGTDPRHPEFWGWIESGPDQRMVEMAAIGLALALVPQFVWEPLSAETQGHVARWLHQINRLRPVDNNWQWFTVLANLGLKRVGAPYDRAVMTAALQRIDAFYEGDGWYVDGVTRNYDYYVPFAFHTYGLVYAASGVGEEGHSAAFRERARRFARVYQEWFDPHGAAIPYGRSLSYRFAQGSFWSALALADEEALPWGRVKGLLLRHLRYWSGQPIFAGDGTLTVGYAYDNRRLAEGYISAGSPYWALKAFLALGAAADHPFWKATEEPLPRATRVVAHAVSGMVLSRDAGQCLALCGRGTGALNVEDNAAKYARFAYSSRFGFSGEFVDTRAGAGSDSALALRDEAGDRRVRGRVERHVLEGDLVYSEWRPWPDVVVDTVLWGHAPWHFRVHRIRTRRALSAEESGFALGYDGDGSGYDPLGPGNWGLKATRAPGSAVVRSARGVSGLRDRAGGRRGQIRPLAPNANTQHPYTVVPVLVGTLAPGEHTLSCAVYGSDVLTPPRWHGHPPVPKTVWDLITKHAAKL